MSVLPTDEATGKAWTRRKYTIDERRTIIKLYDSFKCKTEAMRVINSIEGFENVYVRKIRRWKSQSKPMGRPVSPEFEQEVMEEYLMAMQRTLTCPLRRRSSHSYSMMKECARKVFNNDYWDEDTLSFVKRWQLDKRTGNLQFTNKWVSGMLRRDKDKGACCLPIDEVVNDETQAIEEEQAMVDELVDISCGDEQCGAGSPASSDIDVLFHELADGIDHLAASFDSDYYFNTVDEFPLIDFDDLFDDSSIQPSSIGPVFTRQRAFPDI